MSWFGDPKPYYITRECEKPGCGYGDLYEAMMCDSSEAYSHLVECPECGSPMEAVWVKEQAPA